MLILPFTIKNITPIFFFSPAIRYFIICPQGPPTPCPARVEYATPVFARNYQGVWRYVVQIPYEGYFTQTVEVTRCVQARCHYLDGGCLSSPRWLSLLVAELHYPDVLLETTPQPDVPADYHNYQQFLQKRAGQPSGDTSPATSPAAPHCDGHDDLGCYQVRNVSCSKYPFILSVGRNNSF